MVSQSAHVFCPRFIVGKLVYVWRLNYRLMYLSIFLGNASTRNAKIEWLSGDDDSLKLDPYSLRPLPVSPHLGVSEIAYPDYALALTGEVFRWIINHAPLETLQRVCYFFS